ncbi:AaceriAGL247Cp [[Ashbya] aceris (nom. inval.)]|nr:AaceriAGL247Cp [[Ashbya] aceris (nom. inval.)]
MLRCIREYSAHAYQKTVRLPRSQFSPRSDLRKTYEQILPQACDQLYREQYQELLQKVRELPDDAAKAEFVRDRVFVLHDGPPYANGDLHVGHAMNKILKDIMSRYQLTKGRHVFYRPGWDCHGLPIEIKALRSLDCDPAAISPQQVRAMAAQHAEGAIAAQRSQFQQFGILTDWQDTYRTMDPDYEIRQLSVLQSMFARGLIRRQRKPVYWGTETHTALAEGELEYHDDHVSRAAYVYFPLTDDACAMLRERVGVSLPEQPIVCLIWTSTPWTLLSNRAICFHDDHVYLLLQWKNMLVVAERTKLADFEWDGEEPTVVTSFRGSDLQGLHYTNPLLRDTIRRPLLHGDHVTTDTGTGLVHTAPGHGQEDYLVGQAHGIEVYSPVDHEGRYVLEDIPLHLRDILKDNSGKPLKVTEQATADIIIKLLEEHKMLLHSHEYTHSYPYDWRSKKPVILRATPQWFADLSDMKHRAVQSLESVEFFPGRGKKRLEAFIKSRNEWCISRQRSWGVPIPALHLRRNPDEVLLDNETLAHIISTIRKVGIDSWFEESTAENMKQWLPDKYWDVAHLYYRGRDTIDVWFDSGSSWNLLEQWYTETLGLKAPLQPLADVYLEGSDQHRGWFQSSLLTKVAAAGAVGAPFGKIVTHGFTLDEAGLKMSKSLGNTIAPSSIIEGNQKLQLPRLGVDGLRLLVAQADFTKDVAFGPLIARHVADSLKKIRLTFRFILGNLQDRPLAEYSSEQKSLSPESCAQLRRIDWYILEKTRQLTDKCRGLYDSHSYSNIISLVLYHMSNDLSFYFEASKDTLYMETPENKRRLAIQTTLFHVLDAYRAVLCPIMPALVQEAWNCLPREWLQGDSTPALRRSWPALPALADRIADFEARDMALVAAFRQALGKLPHVTKPEQSRVTIYMPDSSPYTVEDVMELTQAGEVVFHASREDLLALPNVSVLDANDGILLAVEESPKHKCPRCWKHAALEADALCNRCASVLQ